MHRGVMETILLASTYGVGIAIREAAQLGAKRIFIGLGGSATIDMGLGAASALGVRFFDDNNVPFDIHSAKDIYSINACDPKPAYALLEGVAVVALCDVSVPLLGREGGLAVFSPQKGLKSSRLEEHLKQGKRLSEVFQRDCGFNTAKSAGSGAAGGLAAGLGWFARAKLEMGFKWFSERTGFAEKLSLCDVVVTGEGRFDGTSFKGKATAELLQMARIRAKKAVIICGACDYSLVEENQKVFELKYDAYNGGINKENSSKALFETALNIASLPL